MVFWRILILGCARRGVSGALFPKSAYAGLNSRSRVLQMGPSSHFDWTPRNRRSWTSSDPEGSSDKWCGLCRGLISICIMWRGFLKRFDGGCATTQLNSELGMRNAECGDWSWTLYVFPDTRNLTPSWPSTLHLLVARIEHPASNIQHRISSIEYRANH